MFYNFFVKSGGRFFFTFKKTLSRQNKFSVAGHEDLSGSDSVYRLWALRTDQPRKFRPGRGKGDGKGRQGGDEG